MAMARGNASWDTASRADTLRVDDDTEVFSLAAAFAPCCPQAQTPLGRGSLCLVHRMSVLAQAKLAHREVILLA